MRMLMWGGIVLLFVMGMEGCAGRPAPSVNSDAESAASSEQNTAPQKAMTGAEKNASSKSATSEGYDLSSEGEAPDTGDVEFEEDRLPAPPEEVSGEPLETTRVQAQQVEEMPAVSGDEGAKTRIEPSVTAPVEPSVQAPIASHPPVMSRGFRVQILATTEKNNADEVARVARTRIPEPVYVVFESPYYKVRVGDFHDRALALELRDHLRAYGYDHAWVVTTTVMGPKKDSGP